MDFKIDQTGRDIKIFLDGVDISASVRKFECEGSGGHGQMKVMLDLAVDKIEVLSLAEEDAAIIVSIPSWVERTLQILGWIKTSSSMRYLKSLDSEELVNDRG